MQISINKMHDANNPDNSLLKKFDDFYKDNKHIENEMYFYRKPRVDQILFQAEVDNEEKTKFEKIKKDARNNKDYYFNSTKKNNKLGDLTGNGNNNENYFENEIDDFDNLKEKNYYEQNENKNLKNSLNTKYDLNEASMPIIDLEDANIKMDIEENRVNEALDKKQFDETRIQNENLSKCFDDLDKQNNYSSKYDKNRGILSNHNQTCHKSYKNFCTKKFDYTKINKEDLNYYMKFVEFYKNSQDFGNIILKGSQDFELLALELLRDCEYSISLALKQILYPIVDYLEEDESTKDFDIPYNYLHTLDNISKNNNFMQNNLNVHNGFESAHELRNSSYDLNDNKTNLSNFNNNYKNKINSNKKNYYAYSNANAKLLDNSNQINNNNNNNLTFNTSNSIRKLAYPNISESNQLFIFSNANLPTAIQIESNLSNSPKSANNRITASKNTQDSDLYVNSALNDLIGSNMHEKNQWYEHVKTRLRQKISSQELQDLISIAKKMKIDIPDFVINENDKSFAFAKKIRKHLNHNPNSLSNQAVSDKNNLAEMNKLLEDSKQFKVKYDEFSLLEDAIKKANLWRLRASEIESECVNYKNLQNLFNEGKNMPIKLESFEALKLRFLSAQLWQEKYATLPKHSKTRNNNTTQERCKMIAMYSLIEEAEKINFTSSEVISLKFNYEKLREFQERIYLSFEDCLLFSFDNKENLQEFINMLDTLKFTTDVYDFISAKISLLNWHENKDYYLNSKSLKMKHLRNLLKDANQKNLNNLAVIKNFSKQINQMENWLEQISNVFYKEAKPEADKILLKPLLALYGIGKQFELKPEEIEHLLVKCEEVIDFVKECEEALEDKNVDFATNNNILIENKSSIDLDNENINNLNNNLAKKNNFDYSRLLEIKEKFQKLNIICDVFQKIEDRITSVNNWIEKCKEFKKKIQSYLISNAKENSSLTCLEKYSNNFLGKSKKENFNSKNSNNSSASNSKNFNNNNINTNISNNENNSFISCNFSEVFNRFENEKENLSLENRHKMIEILEEYINKNKCFYEDLLALINSAPQCVKIGLEFQDLQNLKIKSEEFMNKYKFAYKDSADSFIDYNNNKSNNSVENSFQNKLFNTEMLLENNCANKHSDSVLVKEDESKAIKILLNNSTSIAEIKQILSESQSFCVTSTFIQNLLILFKSESWTQIAVTSKKMSLSDAEAMIKEANNLSLEKDKLNSIKTQLQITKDWIKNYKKFLNSENLEYEKIKSVLAEGEKLPLASDEIKELEEFLQTLEGDINSAVYYIKNKDYDFDQFKKFVEKISQYNVSIPEFKIIEAMKEFAVEWKNIANKILQCRKLCTLYFKPKQLNSFADFNSFNLIENNTNINSQNLLNPLENNANNSDSNLLPNNSEIYSEDLISNKNKSSSVLSVSGKKRNRPGSYSNYPNNNALNNFNHININLQSNKDSIFNLSENIESEAKNNIENVINQKNKKKNRGKYKKRKIDETNNSVNYYENSNADNNYENFENDFSKDLENTDSVVFLKENNYSHNKKNKINSEKKNKKANNDLLFNDTTNISEIKENNNLNISLDKSNRKTKNNKDLSINNSNVFDRPDCSNQNYPIKKLKKAEKMQYENVLSVINSMPYKDKNNYYPNLNMSKSSSFRNNQNNNDNYSVDLSVKEKGSQTKLQPINSADEIILNLDESGSFLNTNNSNQYKRKSSNSIPQTHKKSSSSYMENISAKKFQTLSYIDQLNLISCSFDLKDENPAEKYCICRRGDDSLNFMIMCENCKEWFHGVCMHITKQLSSKIAYYMCLGCSKRKDISTAAYHSDFLNNKRVDFVKFVEFLNEYDFVQPHIPEHGILIEMKAKMDLWNRNYVELLNNVIEFSKVNLNLLAQQIEANYKEDENQRKKKKSNLAVEGLSGYEQASKSEIKQSIPKVFIENQLEEITKKSVNEFGNSDQEFLVMKNNDNHLDNKSNKLSENDNNNEINNNDQNLNQKAIEEIELSEQNGIQINTLNHNSNINVDTQQPESDNKALNINENNNIYNNDYHNNIINKAGNILSNNNAYHITGQNNNDLESNFYTSKIKNFLLSEALEKQTMDMYLESEGFPIDIKVGSNLILMLKYQDWFKDAYKCMETKKYSEKLNKRVLTNFKTTFEINQIFIANSNEEKEFINFIFPIAKNFFDKIYKKYLEYSNANEQIEPNKEKAQILQQLNSLFDSNQKMKSIPEYKKTQIIRTQVSTYYKLKEQLKSLLNQSFSREAFRDISEQMLCLNFKNLFIQKLKNAFEIFDFKDFKEIKNYLFDNEKGSKNKTKGENKIANFNSNYNNKINISSDIDYNNFNTNVNNDVHEKIKLLNSNGKKNKKFEKYEASKKTQILFNEQKINYKENHNNDNSIKMLIDDDLNLNKNLNELSKEKNEYVIIENEENNTKKKEDDNQMKIEESITFNYENEIEINEKIIN